jgi:uncharacterized protein YpmB
MTGLYILLILVVMLFWVIITAFAAGYALAQGFFRGINSEATKHIQKPKQ